MFLGRSALLTVVSLKICNCVFIFSKHLPISLLKWMHYYILRFHNLRQSSPLLIDIQLSSDKNDSPHTLSSANTSIFFVTSPHIKATSWRNNSISVINKTFTSWKPLNFGSESEVNQTCAKIAGICVFCVSTAVKDTQRRTRNTNFESAPASDVDFTTHQLKR